MFGKLGKKKHFCSCNSFEAWKQKNEKYIQQLQKFLDRVDNINDEKLKKEIIVEGLKFDKVITEILEDFYKNEVK